MGIGDEILCSAEARARQARDPRKVAFRGKDGKARWHPIWDNNPRIATPAEVAAGLDVQWSDNRSGNRPYLDHKRTHRGQFFYNDYRAEAGEIYLTDAEKALGKLAAGVIVLEPNVKQGTTPNKQWGWHNWKELVRLLGDLPLVQFGPPGTPLLRNVRQIVTRDFRAACGMLTGARAAVLHEGAMHHACAVLGPPAVVIFGGYVSPDTTGYAAQVNLFTGGKACGMRTVCPHCREAMDAIRPAEVAKALRALL